MKSGPQRDRGPRTLSSKDFMLCGGLLYVAFMVIMYITSMSYVNESPKMPSSHSKEGSTGTLNTSARSSQELLVK